MEKNEWTDFIKSKRGLNFNIKQFIQIIYSYYYY